MAIIQAHALTQRVISIESREFSPRQYVLRLRVALVRRTKLQVRLYYNQGHVDYAYQLYAETPLLRWDNKEEFRHLPTFPHHHHDQNGDVRSSPLAGDPVSDLPVVLDEIALFLGNA